MPDYSAQIAAQIGASGGPDTKTPVDWRGNETSPPQPRPASWPADVSAYNPATGQGQRPAAGPGPSIEFVSVSAITATTAVINFTVNVACTGMLVNYGTTVAYGSTQNATPASGGPGAIVANLATLTTATLYHFRLSATANGQTTLGLDRTFTTA